METNKEKFLLSSLMNMHRKMELKFEDLKEQYEKKQFGLLFFYDIIFKQNYIREMIYWRDEQFAGYLQLKRGVKITDHQGFDLYEKLVKKMTDNIESRSFIDVMRKQEPWWGYSEAYKKKLNESACKLVKELLTEEKKEKLRKIANG